MAQAVWLLEILFLAWMSCRDGLICLSNQSASHKLSVIGCSSKSVWCLFSILLCYVQKIAVIYSVSGNGNGLPPIQKNDPLRMKTGHEILTPIDFSGCFYSFPRIGKKIVYYCIKEKSLNKHIQRASTSVEGGRHSRTWTILAKYRCFDII
jgi:hypothetical protein